MSVVRCLLSVDHKIRNMNFYNDNEILKFYLSHPVMDKIIKLKERDFVDSANDMLAPESVEDAIDNYDKVLEIVGDLAAKSPTISRTLS